MHLMIKTVKEGIELPKILMSEKPMDEKGEYGEDITEGMMGFSEDNFEEFAEMDIETQVDPLRVVCDMIRNGVGGDDEELTKIPIPAFFDFSFIRYYVPNERDVIELA